MTKMDIKQMVSAPRWFAAYADGKDNNISRPLVCWALVETPNAVMGDAPVQRIVGMVIDETGSVVEASDLENFVGYDFETDAYDIEADFIDHSLN